MLRPVQEVSEEFVPYWDPQLRSHQRAYKKFIQKLHAADYLVYTHPKPKELLRSILCQKT